MQVIVDGKLMLCVCGYAFALAALLYSIIAAFVARLPTARPGVAHPSLPPVTVLKPLCGVETETYECLRSFCEQAYPCYQIVFGVSSYVDPVIAIVQRLQTEFAASAIDLVVDHRQHGSNRKVSNLINMMAAARYDYLVMSDSDVRVRPDYLASVASSLLDDDVGIVTCCYRGIARGGLWSALGAMFINEWFMPSVRVAALIGYRSFVSGATIAIRRDNLLRIGGFAVIADQLADDFRLGELTRGLGLRTELSSLEVETYVSEERFADLVSHELRWRRTIRSLNPSGYGFSFVTFGISVTALQLLVTRGAWPAVALFALTVLANFGIYRSAVSGQAAARLWLIPLRECLHVGLWILSFLTRRVQWRNDIYQVSRDGSARLIKRFQVP